MGPDPSIQPHPRWTAQDTSPRHPKTIEEWDWRCDSGNGVERSKRRLAVAADFADPRAPDQMAVVLRVDLARVGAELTWRTAQSESRGRQIAALSGASEGAIERLQAILDWADLALRNPAEFDSHGVRNLDGPIFDAARAFVAAAPSAWQPIATAPKDEKFDVAWAGDDRRCLDCDVDRHGLVGLTHGYPSVRTIFRPQPTHWRIRSFPPAPITSGAA